MGKKRRQAAAEGDETASAADGEPQQVRGNDLSMAHPADLFAEYHACAKAW